MSEEKLSETQSGELSACSSARTPTPHVSRIIAEKQASGELFFSFEYFPPRTKKTISTLKEKTVQSMASWGPQWMDVTWGAGGTTSELTPDICDVIENRLKVPCLMHLTCTNMPKDKIDSALETAKRLNLRNILALRGDPPHGESEWKPIDTGFACARDLVQHIKAKYGDYFDITVAGYPEGHPSVRKPISDETWDSARNEPRYTAPQQLEDGSWIGVSASDWSNELQYLKSKVEAGASVVISQLFYDAQLFIDFVKEARAAGITVPILPGIMPIRNFALFQRMTGFCKTVIPKRLLRGLQSAKGENAAVRRVGLQWVSEMCRRIVESKVSAGIHVYTMNTELAPAMLLLQMGLGPKALLSKRVDQILSEQKAKARRKAEEMALKAKEAWHPMESL